MSRTMNSKSGSQAKSTTPPPTFSLSQRGILQRQCDCGGVAGLTGQCEECSGKWLRGLGRVSNPPSAGDEVSQMNAVTGTQQLPGHSFGRMSVQAKLAIGAPGDKYEQEADRVASQVVQQINAPASAPSTQGQSVQRQEDPDKELQAKPSISNLQRSPLKPEEKEDEDKIQPKSILQRREAIAVGEASTDLESAINSARGSGQPLDAGLQASMGQAMGADFSGVRVHTDAQSDQLNKSIQAKAFTTGQDVFFRQGEYNPGSRRGHELIAHELTHVVQQNGGAVMRSPLPSQEKPLHPATETLSISKGTCVIQGKSVSEVIQRMIWYDSTVPEFQVDGKKPAFVGSVKAMVILASQSRDHIVPYAAIENDLAVMLNQWMAGTTTLADIQNFTESLFPNKGGNQSYNDMVKHRTTLFSTLNNRTTNNYEKHARALLSRLNSSVDNIRAGNAGINSSIGENLDTDFLPGFQTVPLGGLNVMGNTGAITLPAGTRYLRLSPASEAVLWEYQSHTTQDLSFVLNPASNTQVSSVDAPRPTGILPATTVAGLPVVVFDPRGVGLPYYYS